MRKKYLDMVAELTINISFDDWKKEEVRNKIYTEAAKRFIKEYGIDCFNSLGFGKAERR